MAFTAGELANIANAALDFYIKGPAMKQTIQDRPLYDAVRTKQKTFPGGKENISIPVKGDYTTAISGFTHDDTVSYSNPANIKRAAFPWKEIHAGIALTLTELKKDGISVVDSADSASVTNHSKRELTALTGLLEDKLDDMSEGWARTFNDMLWADGTQDAKEIAGIASIISDTATTGVIGGLDRATISWWRNREKTAAGSGAITSNTSTQALIKALNSEMRQLRRYGGRPTLFLAGSDFLDALGNELRLNGNHSDTGFSRKSNTDISMAEIIYKGNVFQYDPTLDDLGKQKYCYIIDPRHLYLDTMDGEDMKQHTPTRPADQYVMYRAMTYTGGLVADQMNCHGVYEIS
ncbi:MAG: phage major capsid protein [Rhodobacteraceae bacterium]|nr:phage major capsid protein [Paracoccaceae bacterium]